MSGRVEIIEWLHNEGAIRIGHFGLTGGRHSNLYTDMSVALSDVDKALEITEGMADLVSDLSFDTVAGPAHADDKWAFALAIKLRERSGRKVRFVYAQEKTKIVKTTFDGKLQQVKLVTEELVFPRQQRRYVTGKRVLIVCDVMSSGSTAEKMIRLIESEGGIVAGIVVACGHSGIQEVLGSQVFELLNVPWEMHEPPCPADLGPIDTELGHGLEFITIQHEGTVS